jgi:hypothetical protein
MRPVQLLCLSTILAVGCGPLEDQNLPGPDAASAPVSEPGLTMRLIEPLTPITVPMSATGLNMPWEQSQASLTNTSGCPNSYSTWGSMTSDPTINQDIADATELVNRMRKTFGFSCATEVPLMSIAAWQHSKYFNLATGGCVGATAHNEVSGCAEFAGTTPSARMNGVSETHPYAEVMNGGFPGSTLTAQQSIDKWMLTAYHQLPFIECGGDRIGYGPDHHPTGDWRAPTVHTTTLDFARSAYPCSSNGVSEWPLAGTWGVNRSWDGNEAPVPPVSFPSGPVFTSRHPTAATQLGGDLYDLSTTPATGVPGHYYTGQSPDPNHDPNNLLLPYEAIFIPTSPLKAQTFYEIHFHTSAGDVWWQIKTGN